MFRGLVSARLKAEYAYFKLIANDEGFKKVWCLGGAICTVESGEFNITL